MLSGMKLTTKGRYAVTAMLDLAMHQGPSPVPLIDIAQRQTISQTYLEQLFGKLRRAGLLASTRGPAGGYLTAKPIEEISVGDIIQAIEENVDATQCQGEQNCQGGARCLTHQLWADLSDAVANFLRNITLADLIKKPSIKRAAKQQQQEYLLRRSVDE